MASVIFIDQENGDIASTTLSKDRLISTSSGKPLLKSNPRKVFGSSGTVVKPRKALGNVNLAVPQKGPSGVKNSAPVTKQASEACIKHSKQSYPEIEKCVPYDPADFETFDVPEEHKLSHLYLAGIPLFVHEKEAAKFDALTQEPAPMDVPVFSWESGKQVSKKTLARWIKSAFLECYEIIQITPVENLRSFYKGFSAFMCGEGGSCC